MDIVSIINYKHLTKDTGKLTKKNKKTAGPRHVFPLIYGVDMMRSSSCPSILYFLQL